MSTPRDPVQFTRESADRIAGAVRTLELTPASGSPLNFEAVFQSQSRKVFRMATFTGPWSIGDNNTVTFKYQTSTPNTASVTNLFFPITDTESRDCAIAKDGTAWFLIDVPLATATAVFVTSGASRTVFGTASTSVINFFSPGSTSQLTFVTGVSASLNTADCTITVTAQTATATSVSMGGTQTAVSISMSSTQTITVIGSTVTATYLTFG